jgi:copper/silver efflux system protein
VAVWVGYIALFGTAIETGIVMVVYLEEALKRKRVERGALFTEADLLQAVQEGAKLRLRPKGMTAATAIAGLLPIMWSSSIGSEVIRPLAAPVVGGMASRLVHILVVTPVLFAFLREREMRRQEQELAAQLAVLLRPNSFGPARRIQPESELCEARAPR